jgi:hypothetical protein
VQQPVRLLLVHACPPSNHTPHASSPTPRNGVRNGNNNTLEDDNGNDNGTYNEGKCLCRAVSAPYLPGRHVGQRLQLAGQTVGSWAKGGGGGGVSRCLQGPAADTQAAGSCMRSAKCEGPSPYLATPAPLCGRVACLDAVGWHCPW